MTHEKFEGERTLMRIHIGESDKWHGRPLYEAIVEMLRKEKFSGVTVLRGVAGYGGSSVYHTDKILRLSQDLPIILEIVEATERIEQILPRLDAMVEGGLITLEKVRVILYRALSRRQEVGPHDAPATHLSIQKISSRTLLRPRKPHASLGE
jgi:hypothetical protein